VADTRAAWVGRRRISKQKPVHDLKKNCIASINPATRQCRGKLVGARIGRVWLAIA